MMNQNKNSGKRIKKMGEKEEKNRWIVLFIIVAVFSLIGVSVLTLLLQKILKG